MTSTTKPDYWSILGILPGSDLNEIKTAFRSEARRWHPDLNVNDSNAEERFKLVNEAYAVLSDPQKRSLWEQNNSIDSQELFATGFPTYKEYINIVLGINIDNDSEDYHSVNEGKNFSGGYDDHLEDLPKVEEYSNEEYSNEEYSKPAHSPYEPPPVRQLDDIETLVDLTPEDALYGTTLELELRDGTIVEFTTPPFAGDGWRLQLKGVVVGGKDHFIQLRVQTEDGLRIDGLRVLYRLELFPQDGLFGCGVEIPTLDGPVVLQVPPKSSSGRLLRLRGRGLNYNEIYGDQIVEIVIVLPADLTDSEMALYRRLQELSSEHNV